VGNTIQIHRPTAIGNTSLINANSLIANAVIATVADFGYHAVVPRFATLLPSRTTLSFGFKGVDGADSIDSGFVTVQNDIETEMLDETRYIKSYTNEIADIAGEKSCQFNVTFTTGSEFVSPVIDLRKKTGLMVENLVNNDDTNEANTRYGSALSKYVSLPVVLDNGQEAEDIHVWVSAYRPSGTDVKVYVKFHNGEDQDNIDLKGWTELTANTGAFQYSSTPNVRDFIDFEYTVPASAPAANPTAAYINADTGILEYTRGDGANFVGYKAFMIKLVILSNNPALVPRMNDVRAICLQA
jgi:hypothetical protein